MLTPITDRQTALYLSHRVLQPDQFFHLDKTVPISAKELPHDVFIFECDRVNVVRRFSPYHMAVTALM